MEVAGNERINLSPVSIRFNNNLSLYLCSDVNRTCLYGCFDGNPLRCKEKDVYRTMAKFWGHLFLINFAVGVVTGILQEFQFGMNWSEYSRFVGDVFGALLAVEALLAFFMESTFIGLWIFGWDRLPKKVHLLSIWLVSIGTMLSAFWILAANSFMQEPVGFAIKNGRAEMTDFFAIIKNPQLWVEFPHVIFGALATGAFFIAYVSAYKMLKKQEMAFLKSLFRSP